MSNIIKFKYSIGPYGWLSNFSKYPIQIGDIVYPTSEHAYQCFKATNIHDFEYILDAKTPKEAAIRGRTLKEIRKNWDNLKIEFMKTIIHYKIEQHEDIKNKLLETGDAILIEDSPWDSFWGCGKDGNGKNMLGKIWMEMRDQWKNLK